MRRRVAERLERRLRGHAVEAMGVKRDALFVSVHAVDASLISAATLRLLQRCGFKTVTFEDLVTLPLG